MAAPQHPALTPQFCFSTSALKDFLRVSRSIIDDTIPQSLNALSVPSLTPFDPTSTSRPQRSPPRRRLPATTCGPFAAQVLFPSWQARTDVLDYCASVAASARDAADPESDAADRERVVDERLDPYSGRFFPRESPAQALAALVGNERAVEEIVRERSWRVVGERCEGVGEGSGGGGWREAMQRWRAEQR